MALGRGFGGGGLGRQAPGTGLLGGIGHAVPNLPTTHGMTGTLRLIPKPGDDEPVERYFRVGGLDLGQVKDPSALCVLRRSVYGHSYIGPRDPRWRITFLKNLPLGTDYCDLADWVIDLALDVLPFDATGGGRVEANVLRRSAMQKGSRTRLRPISIATSQMKESVIKEKGFWSVPKREIVTAINVMIQTGKVIPYVDLSDVTSETERQQKTQAAMRDFEVLVNQCRTFEERRTARGGQQFGAEGQNHDDLVIAFGLAAWWCYNYGGVKEPAFFM